MISPVRFLRLLFTNRSPETPRFDGPAFVFGSAPDPVVPAPVLEGCRVVTANASQVSLERFGVKKPFVTFMRANMGHDRGVDRNTLETLSGRGTENLVIIGDNAARKSKRQVELLAEIDYRYDRLWVIDRDQRDVLLNDVLQEAHPLLARRYYTSMGLNAAMLSLRMGASAVYIAGISFQKAGYSYNAQNFARAHVDGDREFIHAAARKHGCVYGTDEEFAEDAGLKLWNADGAFAGASA